MCAVEPLPLAGFRVTELEQVALVVRDVQKSMENYWNNFGIGPWTILHFPPSELHDVMYHGKPGRFGCLLALGAVGPMKLELIEPLEGDSTYSDFLREHGEGVHHLGWYIVDDINQAIRTMEQAGFPCLTSARNYRSHFAYFDTTRVLGTILEAFQTDVSIPLRPARIWPE